MNDVAFAANGALGLSDCLEPRRIVFPRVRQQAYMIAGDKRRPCSPKECPRQWSLGWIRPSQNWARCTHISIPVARALRVVAPGCAMKLSANQFQITQAGSQ